jgi:hypothetical protein
MKSNKDISLRLLFWLVVFLLAYYSDSKAQVDYQDIAMPVSTNAQAEISLAINPANPKNLILCCINGSPGIAIDRYFSTNGGYTWVGTDGNPNGATAKSDPVAFFDVSGTAYCAYIGDGNHNVYVQKTINNGIDWSSQVNATNWGDNSSVDKPHAIADLSGTHPSNIYVAWMGPGFATTTDQIFFSHSTDGGQTFTVLIDGNGNPKSISSIEVPATRTSTAPNIAIGPTGQICDV